MASKFKGSNSPTPHGLAVFFLALVALLGGCAPQSESCGDMKNMSRWGQQRTLGPAWVEGAPVVLLDCDTLDEQPDAFKADFEPRVLNIALAARYLNAVDVSQNVTFRWRLLTGSGGGAREWTLDARPFQQVSVTAQTVKISLVAERSFVDEPKIPFGNVSNLPVEAAALVAVGNTSTEPATYTQMFRTLADSGLIFITSNFSNVAPQIPAGASSFRLIGASPTAAASPAGAGATDTPFADDFVVTLNQGPFPVLQLSGTDLLETLKSGAFIVLPPGIDSLALTNNVGNAVTNFGIQWGLDL